MKFIFQYSIKENLRKKCNFFICFITCFLVSLVCLVAKSIIKQGALLFLMLGEKSSGEIDFTITPSVISRNLSNSTLDDYHRDNAFINFTNFEELMKEGIIEEEKKKNIQNPYNNSAVRTYFNGYSPYNKLYLYLIDTERERELEIGRSYPYDKLKEGECLVHKNIIVNETDTFNISILMNDFITNTLLYYYHDKKKAKKGTKTYKGLEHILSEFDQYITFTCKIVDKFTDNYGKENENEDDVVIMEQESFYKYIAKFIPKIILDYFPEYPDLIKNINPNDYANILIINFPKNRLNYYMEDDYDNLILKGVRYMNDIVKKLGDIQNYKVNFPLIYSMNKFRYGTIMLNLILNLILLALFGLSLILTHSLLLMTTETHSFEFGTLRLVGNSKKNIIIIIILEYIYFSIPAFILAVISAHFMLIRINEIIKEELNTDLNISMTLSGFIISLILNFLGPILSSIFPIKNILRKNIASTLNTILNKTQGMKIEVISLQQQELTSLVIFGLITFIYGASIYYFLPLSLVSMNFGMIGAIFLWILFGILLGFVLLSRNIELLFQTLLTNCLLFFTKSYTKILILKNLAAHRLKNKKTSLMFSLSVGVFIMTSVGFDLLLQYNKNIAFIENGSEISAYKKNSYFTAKEVIKPLMELFDKKLIDSFSFYTVDLNKVCLSSNIYISNYGTTEKIRQRLLAINSGFFDKSTKLDLTIENQISKYKKYTPAEQLYYSKFRGKIGISGFLTYQFNANLKTDFLLQITNKNNRMIFISKPAFILNNAWGLYMSNQPSDVSLREGIISIPLYMELFQKCRNYFSESFKDYSIVRYETLPIWGINIYPKGKLYDENIEAINTILKTIDSEVTVNYFVNYQKSLDTAAKIVFFNFNIVSSIVLIFCLFNLTASMTINIYDQKKEIAIFRSLGTRKNHIIFIYIYESFILVLSSSLIGLIIGSSISFTMAKQWTIFTAVNVNFNLPIGSIILIITFSIFGGVISTYFPAKKMISFSVAELIKSN